MNINVNADKTDFDEIHCVSFNQDYKCLALGTKTGYSLLSLNSLDSLDPSSFSTTEFNEIHIIEKLFDTPVVAIVSLSCPRKLRVRQFEKGEEIWSYTYSNIILSVKMNNMRMVVCLEDSLYIHDTRREMKMLHKILNTPLNSTGLCSLSTNSDHCYLAYPVSSTVGKVHIFDAINLNSKLIIPSHDYPLVAVAFSHQGTRIATASEKGIVIKVFDSNDGSKLFEFQRGVRICATIYCVAFSVDGNYLCYSSNSESVFVFRLDESTQCKQNSSSKASISLGEPSSAASVSSISSAPLYSIDLPHSGKKNVCAVILLQKMLRVLIASMDGYLYVYDFSRTENGQCITWRRFWMQSGDLCVEDSWDRFLLDDNNITDIAAENVSCYTHNIET